MRAIAITPGVAGAQIVERDEPKITTPDQVKMRVLRVGICGTDREELVGGRANAPAGAKELVIGHEMLGQVTEVGAAVKRVQVGDHAAFTVRRGCGKCANCNLGRADMCQTGNYRERGIKALDGYQTEFVVDQEEFIVRVPPELAPVGVLLEPLSIVEKALDEAWQIQSSRNPQAAVTPDWRFGRRCLVAGMGPVGLLAAMILRLRGCEVFGLDIVDAANPRPKWLEAIGGSYIDGRQVKPQEIASHTGSLELICDASGVASLEFDLLDALGLNGIYVLTGIPGGDRPLQIAGAELIRRLVLGNKVMFGSVNAARGHFQMGVDDLAAAQARWGGTSNVAAALITHHLTPEAFVKAPDAHPAGAIKEVVEWGADRGGGASTKA